MRAGPAPFAFHPGSSIAHRAPFVPKLVLLTVLAVLVTARDSPVLDPAALVLAAVAHRAVGLPLAALRRTVLPVLVLAVPIGVWLTWTRGWATGLSAVTDVLTVVVLAGVVTGTTSPSTVLDAVVAPARLLARMPGLGRVVDPEAVALTFALTLGSVPAIARAVAEAREAAAARGLGRSWRAFLVPATMRTVAHAFAVSDALTARGLGD